ncbi:MAG: thioredoxin domain-containing protein [Chloroflexi bacterium]|nr:thioredoxin domain-containing protein [Chloroflexota bacterium]
MSRSTPPASRRDRRAQARYDRPVTPHRKPTRKTDQRPAWQSPVLLTSIGAVLIGAVIVVFASGILNGGSKNLVTPPTSYAGITQTDESAGAANAPVVIEIFSDFQCPACKLFVQSDLPGLLTDFVRPGLVRIESKDIDIIDRGSGTESLRLAVGAACAAEQGKYWDFHDLVFWNQGRENRGDHSDEFIARIATAAEVEMTAWSSCITRTDLAQQVATRTTEAAAAGINSTPTLRINGKALSGVPTYDQLHTLITQALASYSPSPSSSPAPSPAAS